MSALLANGVLSLSGWQLFWVLLALTHVTTIGVTVYLHRSQAHRALDLHPVVSHFFRFWLWLTTGMLTAQWVAVHRKHHARTETPDDPHSPRTRGLATVLFSGSELYRDETGNEETLRRYGPGMPDDWLERHVYTRYPNLGVAFLVVIDVVLFGLPGVSMWAIQMMWIPFWAGGVINGCGHFTGYRNFATPDASSNIVPLGILVCGEELHNNHHAYASSARLSNRWFEFDLGWLYICLLAALRLATVRRVTPKPHLSTGGKAVLDDATLQAIMRNRYEVMAAYARMIERACWRELGRAGNLSRDDRRAVVMDVRRWMRRAWNCQAKPDLRALTCLDDNRRIRVYVDMYEALRELWTWPHASRAQLLVQLQDWCRCAEQSGVEAVAAFSARLRRYT
ncbi:fatty acid desaturase [Burkholderia sp. FERM BP-3421]|uniref:DesA family fatty acid desaturase n=1 Tax=Burkholderia sp. FERM BP-3421 TaxID=1494466 RepID=UPI00235DD7B7|nr:fatty acid desaturase [Burkholderia sp. FERM BP-3421]WDD90904.1 fatty acid desaturase [Burkholderia sp. FERM BP-3421]